jgi:8-oxo-dGTP pyrophosphatase MutT (NUDIX family)/GNAT superfamily N-acetyltransferase
MGVSVRRLDPEHACALGRLWQDANDRRTDELEVAAIAESAPVLARPAAFGVGVFDAEVLVAAAVAMPARGDDGRSSRNVAGLAHISSVVTEPRRWGEGLAAVALRAVLSQAMRRGYARCQLWVFEQNDRARRLYERAGFESSGRVLRLPDRTEPMVQYLRELTAPSLVARAAARVLCLDGSGRVLVMRWRDPVDGYQLWEPPGGGVEPGEAPLDTVRREWVEETGLPYPLFVGEPTMVARDVFWAGGRMVGEETFFLARTPTGGAPEPFGFSESEVASYLGYAWVGADEVRAGEVHGDPLEPDLLPVLERLHA